MKRLALSLAVLAVLLGPGPRAFAKFGISKTKVVLARVRPPANPLVADSVYANVRSDSPEVTGAHVAIVRGRLEDALRASDLYRLAERAKDADAALTVSLAGLRAEVRDEIRMETKYVKIGERQEWNDKKKKMETKDVYGNRSEPVSWRVADGSLSATVEVQGGEGGPRTTDVGASYHQQFKIESGVPPEASTEESLRRFLVTGAADNVIAQVTFAPDPVEALLAVNDELKAGNKLAEAGLFQEALDEWSRRSYKGGTEAARLHNLGVAHEALAYKLPPFTPEHRGHLEQAKDMYLKALQLDSGEKYFRDPPPRVDQSLAYSATAALFVQEVSLFREQKADARQRRPAAPEPKRAAGATPSAAAPAAPNQPLRNGSFESALLPWSVSGKGTLVTESGRGKVLEIAATPDGTTVQQSIDVAIPSGHAAKLGLDYKVVSGEAALRVNVVYADANGKERTSTLEITGGEGPGAWASWTGDVSSLRPRPTRVREIRVVAEGGGVRLDNVALNVP
jgi:hypothetical protein